MDKGPGSHLLTKSLSNGPDKKESNKGYEHVGIVCTILLISLNSNSYENYIK